MPLPLGPMTAMRSPGTIVSGGTCSSGASRPTIQPDSLEGHARGRGAGEAQPRTAVDRRWLDPLEPVQPRLPAARLTGALAGLVLADELLLVIDVRLLGCEFAPPALAPFDPQLGVLRVVAGVFLDGTAGDLDHLRAHVVEKAAVVGDEHERGATRRA